jgi:hypothetical protein
VHVVILGKRYQIRYVGTSELGRNADGMCDEPSAVNKAIRIRQTLTGERRLEVLIHEMLHAADWHKDEQWVSHVARDIARALTRSGYTLCNGQTPSTTKSPS